MERMIFLFILFVSNVAVDSVQLPDAGLTTPRLIKYWGYPVETHNTITNDGYILTLHRIPYGKTNRTSSNKVKPVFFLLHGMVGSSASFLLNLPKQSLGFVLADAGFDVWLGNNRGNIYSRRHVSLSNSSKEFWDFSFAEMGKYDLPSMLEYVLNFTRQEQVYFAGYSQGNMLAFAGLSENIELQKKIKMIFALGPVTKMHDVNYLVQLLAKYDLKVRHLIKMFGINEFLTATDDWYRSAELMCSNYHLICDVIFSLLAGYDMKNLNETRVPLYVSYIPSGTSAKNFVHYLQIVHSNAFKKYDYGVAGNLKHYSSEIPPEYDIRKVRIPTVLMFGTEDVMATIRDGKWLSARLPNVVANIEVQDYNHIDFIWAMSAGKLLHEKIIELVRDYSET